VLHAAATPPWAHRRVQYVSQGWSIDARASLPFRKWWVWLGGHAKKFLERLTICSLVSLTWQGHAPSPQILPSFRSPAVPPAGLFVFGARCSRNSQLWNAFPVLAKSIEVVARGPGHLFRVKIGQFWAIAAARCRSARISSGITSKRHHTTTHMIARAPNA
jgi:hypothetical protein